MCREIKFRGKRKDTNEWVYGFYYQIPQLNIYEILTGKIDITTGFPTRESYEIIPETTGQYTGLKDIHSKYIYESDIVSDGSFNYEVYRHDSGQWKAGQYCLWEYISDDGTENNWEVVGNIYLNPNLLKLITK
jgi:hypothetical protein